MLWLNKYVYATKKLKHCTPFTGFNLVPYEYDEHECNTVMVLDHDKLFCVSVGERASSVDDINSMTQIPEKKKKEIDKVWFRLNPLTEQNCEKEKKEINMKKQWVILPWLSSLHTKQVLYMYVPEERESSLLDLHFKQYESHWDLISVFVQERKMAVTYNKIHRKFICLIP